MLAIQTHNDKLKDKLPEVVRYLMRISRTLNYTPVMKISGTVEMGGSNLHMSATCCAFVALPFIYIPTLN